MERCPLHGGGDNQFLEKSETTNKYVRGGSERNEQYNRAIEINPYDSMTWAKKGTGWSVFVVFNAFTII